MLDFPAAKHAVGEGGAEVVGSSAEEDEALGETPGPANADPMQAAVLALTAIVKHLQKGRPREAASSSLQNALDKAEVSLHADGSTGLSSGSSRSKAAAYRLLKEALKSRPEQIYSEVERLLEEDLLNRRAVGNLSGTQATARAWLEHRSRLGYYPTTIRLAWARAGIWDALHEKKHDEARA